MGFQGDVSGNGVFLSCIPCENIAVIPARKVITLFRAGRKRDRIAYFCGNLSALHFSAVCVKNDRCFRLFPCRIICGICFRSRMLLPCISCKYGQFLIFIPAFEAVAFSGCVREYDTCTGNHLCTVRSTLCAIIIYVGNGDSNGLLNFPFRIQVKVFRQFYLLPFHVISAAPIRLCVPSHKIISGVYEMPHDRIKRLPVHDSCRILTGITVRVRNRNTLARGIIIGVISDKISFRCFCKVKVLAFFYRAVIRAVPWKLLRVCVFVVQCTVDQYPARLYLIISAKYKG